MRKLLFANIGAAVACGVGAMGATIAITHKVKADQARTESVADINNIFKNIQNLYAGQTEIKTVTDSNYNSLYTFIQQSIAGTVATLKTSQEKALALQKADLLEELNKVKAALDAHSSFDNESFSAIYTAIQQLNGRLDGITNLQEQFEAKLNILESDYKDTAKDLWDAYGALETLINTSNAQTTIRFDALESVVNQLQAKLLSVDELRSMILSTNQVVTEIQDRLTALETNLNNLSDKTGYDIAALHTAIAALQTAHTDLETKADGIDAKVTEIWAHLGNIYDKLDALESKQDLTEQDVADIKTEIAAIKLIQGTTGAAQAALLTQFNEINNKVNELFIGNAQLQSQVNYLNDQNTLLYQNFLYLQTAINKLEDLYGSASAATVSIKPRPDDNSYVIYEKASGQSGTVRFPSIEVPNLEKARRFAIYIKVTNTSNNTSYVTQIIDAYPDYDYKLIGSSTQGFNNEQFLVSIGLDRTVDKININGLWMRKSSDAWKTSKDIDNTKVQITNVVVTY